MVWCINILASTCGSQPDFASHIMEALFFLITVELFVFFFLWKISNSIKENLMNSFYLSPNFGSYWRMASLYASTYSTPPPTPALTILK